MQEHKDVLKNGQKPPPLKGADTDDASARRTYVNSDGNDRNMPIDKGVEVKIPKAQ